MTDDDFEEVLDALDGCECGHVMGIHGTEGCLAPPKSNKWTAYCPCRKAGQDVVNYDLVRKYRRGLLS